MSAGRAMREGESDEGKRPDAGSGPSPNLSDKFISEIVAPGLFLHQTMRELCKDEGASLSRAGASLRPPRTLRTRSSLGSLVSPSLCCCRLLA